MKRTKLLWILLALAVAGCGKASADDSAGKTVASAQSAAEAEAQAEEDGSEEGGAIESEEAGTAGGYVFQTDGVSISVDEDAAPIIEELGEPANYFEAASCAFEGLDKIYTYASFEIDTYPDGDLDRIQTIILKDDLVSTAEGISIGDSREELNEVYGEGTEDNSELVYEKGGMKLCFILKDDSVAAIEYRSAAMDE